MMKLKRATITLVSASIVVMAGLVVLPNTAFASPSSPTLHVATSGTNVNNDCQSAINPCQTISFALTQAVSGATIKVEAGVYNEQVQITKGVTIVGAGANQTVIEPSTLSATDTDSDGGQPILYAVDVVDTTGVNLKDLGINGSAASTYLDGDSRGCAQDPVGVYYHDASGSMTNDTVTDIEMPVDLFGCQGGLGVYVTTDIGSAVGSALTMNSDNVNNYDKNGITCDDPTTVCTIKNTTVTGIGSTPAIAQNGIQIWAAAATLRSDDVTGNTYDGQYWDASGELIINPTTLVVKNNQISHNDSNLYIIQDTTPGWVVCGSPTDVSCSNGATVGTVFMVTGNHVSDATNEDAQAVGSGFGDGIDLDSVTEATTVAHNVVDDNPSNGIAFYGASNVAASRNTARNDDNGFYFGLGSVGVTANANTVHNNSVSSSVNDGFFADTTSGGNSIAHNSSQLNGSLDAQDLSTGSGTAGTNNTWLADNCTTSDPSGLCHTAASVRVAGHAKGHRGSKSDSHGAGQSTSARGRKSPHR
jgi:hypothetical protein